MSESDLKLMRCMDELHMQYPFAGSRMMRDLLNRQGHHIGRRHTRTLMKKMGINALYRKPNLSQANQAHRKYPYLLKGLAIQRSNQVWSTDITYIPMAKGVTEQEVEAAKADILKKRVTALEDSRNIHRMLIPQMKRNRTLLDREQRDLALAKISKGDVDAVIQKYIKLDQLVEVMADQYGKVQPALKK